MKFLLCFLVFIFLVEFVSAGVYVSEIMYNPPGKDNNKEYVELYLDGVDIENWTIADEKSSDRLIKLQEGASDCSVALIVEEGYDYSSIFCSVYNIGATIGNGLNNKGDTITLYDSSGEKIISVNYDDSYGYGDENALCINEEGEHYSCEPTPGVENEMLDVEDEVEESEDDEEYEEKERVVVGREPQLSILSINGKKSFTKMIIKDKIYVDIYLYSGEEIGNILFFVDGISGKVELTMDDTFSEFRIKIPFVIPKSCDAEDYTFVLEGLGKKDEKTVTIVNGDDCVKEEKKTVKQVFSSVAESNINSEKAIKEYKEPIETKKFKIGPLNISIDTVSRRLTTYLILFVFILVGYYILFVR